MHLFVNKTRADGDDPNLTIQGNKKRNIERRNANVLDANFVKFTGSCSTKRNTLALNGIDLEA